MNIWKINLRHLRAVVAIAEQGSISAAARAVSITQPAITQGLARLEELLDETLFERRPDGMRVTEAGSLVVSRAREALKHVRSPRITIAQMHALIALALEGGYAGAAQKTGLSQPTLHRSVNDLAIVLRRQLVERHGKTVRLTEQGRLLVRRLRLAEAELRACVIELANLRGQDAGKIVIGAMPLSRAHLLPSVCISFMADRHGVIIEVIEGSYSDLLEPLRDGEIDLMIGALRDQVPEDLSQAPLFMDRPAVFARAGHPLGNQKPTAERLASYPWIVPPRNVPLRESWERWFREARLDPPQVPVECSSVIAIREILRETDFLTVLSGDQLRVELEAKWVEAVAEVPQWFHRSIGITTRSGWRPTPAQKLFMDHLTKIASAL